MIDIMRQERYPGSDIVIEAKLSSGGNYSRYLASYQSEGNKIFALLTIPDGERPKDGWPVIVFNHGYILPELYRSTERYSAYVDGFASQGYMVLSSDYRGHGDSEGLAPGGYGSPAYTVDVLNGLAAIKTHPDADPDRIGMWGHSMGGYITLRAMVVSQEIRAGVIWAGVVGSYPDLLENWDLMNENIFPTPDPNSRQFRWRNRLLETYGLPEDNPEFWASISPTNYINDLSGPLQLHHGTADYTVPVDFSQSLAERLRIMGKHVELHVYQGEDHNITRNFDAAIAESVRFFDETVKAAEPKIGFFWND